jgi:hypothetical protein
VESIINCCPDMIQQCTHWACFHYWVAVQCCSNRLRAPQRSCADACCANSAAEYTQLEASAIRQAGLAPLTAVAQASDQVTWALCAH